MTTKAIKTSLLEKRFKKLHTLVDFAKESCQAILFHTKRLEDLNPTEEQTIAYQKMVQSIILWIDKLNLINFTMKGTEAMYYTHQSTDRTTCQLIEAIPVCPKAFMPNTFQMTETFYRVAFYVIEGDPFKTGKREYTVLDILQDIQELVFNIHHCLHALNTATYDGIWKSTGLLVSQLYDDEPNSSVEKLLSTYKNEKEQP